MGNKLKAENIGFNERHYVPCLRWKQGEYQGLLQLREVTKYQIVPLLEVPEINFDFETREDVKTIDKHLEKFAQRVLNKWGKQMAFVDLRLISPSERMHDGKHPLKYVFEGLKDVKALAVPVTGMTRDMVYQQAVKDEMNSSGQGVCFRISLEEAADDDLGTKVGELLKILGAQLEVVDLILDCGAPKYEPLEGFTTMMLGLIGNLPELPRWRSFTICGTSFPQSMGALQLGGQKILRYEWLFYKRLLHLLGKGMRKPTFGDYGITHPDVVAMDMRLVKPAGTLRYTVDDAWYVIKGPNVRDNGTTQYQDHCARLAKSNLFLGKTFSAGDEYVEKCAQGAVGTGSLTTWRWVGTNHHLEKVVADLANFFGS